MKNFRFGVRNAPIHRKWSEGRASPLYDKNSDNKNVITKSDCPGINLPYSEFQKLTSFYPKNCWFEVWQTIILSKTFAEMTFNGEKMRTRKRSEKYQTTPIFCRPSKNISRTLRQVFQVPNSIMIEISFWHNNLSSKKNVTSG